MSRKSKRQPKGVPTGGQFAAQSRRASEITLERQARGPEKTEDGKDHPIRVTARKGRLPVDVELAKIAEETSGGAPKPLIESVTSVVGDINASIQVMMHEPNSLGSIGVLAIQLPGAAVRALREAKWHPDLARFNKDIPQLRFLDTELPTIRDFKERRALDVFKKNWAGQMRQVERVMPNAPTELNETIARQWDVADERQRGLEQSHPESAREWQQVKKDLVAIAESTDVLAASEIQDSHSRQRRYASTAIKKEAAGMFADIAHHARRLQPRPTQAPEEILH